MLRDELKVWYLVKNAKKVKKDNDFIWCVVRDKDFKIKIVKNLFHNRLYYNGFNISANSIHSVEITKFFFDKYRVRAKTTEHKKDYLKHIENLLYKKMGLFNRFFYRNFDNILNLILFFKLTIRNLKKKFGLE